MLPRIGIRPVIDGRQFGVREDLEEHTMRMAKSAAELISANVFHANGQPVECVIADTTIGGGAEAAACADKFSKENVCATLSVTPCWCYGSETMDLDPLTIKAVWGFNGTERPGAVYLAAVMAAHNQRGLPAFSIYGHEVQDKDDTEIPQDVKEKILRFARSAITVGTMRNRAYLNIGGVSMGIAGSYCDADIFQKYFGLRAEWTDMSEIIRRIELGIYDHDEYEKLMSWIKANIKEGEDRNKPEKAHSREQKDAEWEYCAKMTLIFMDLMQGNPKLAEMGFEEEARGKNAIAGGFQGQRQWTDFRPNADFTEAIMNSSFDWNGKREQFVFATENDTLNALTMIFLHLLTARASVFADVRTYWSAESMERVTGKKAKGLAANGIIHLINSGAAALDGTGEQKDENGNPTMKRWWDLTDDDIKACLDATNFSPANVEYFRGGGFSSTFSTKGEMPVTMARINIIDGIGPTLQIAEGYTVELPEDINKTLLDRTDPTWPSTWFTPKITGEGAFTDTYSVMANWGANHGAFSYGHIGDDLITVASMLRIPVSMHNVEKERIYRPHAWSAFGTNDLEGADYRACKHYGPIYK
ncbi:MAG: L-fucose isomerase [Clostridiales bacterium]|nr:L-fucose isomerase [Clostridiales bacterium]